MDPVIVKEELKAAMDNCRTDWSEPFKQWIIDLVDIGLRSSVGCYEGSWYHQKRGIPTGGSTCVQLANITVFYIMNQSMYKNTDLMKKIYSIKRYIDDGVGFFEGNRNDFIAWIKNVNDKLRQWGLNIDEYDLKETGVYIAFLDIQFCFDCTGKLQTDLYIKETDSKRYLHFTSAHPNHIFSGIVYSQCIRLRRIINSDVRLNVRMEELKEVFKTAGYPIKMIENIGNGVLAKERTLESKPHQTETADEKCKQPIRIVSTYGCDDELIQTVQKFQPLLEKTKSFKVNAEQSAKSSIFQFVKKTDSNLHNKLVKLKDLALGSRTGATKPCKQKL